MNQYYWDIMHVILDEIHIVRIMSMFALRKYSISSILDNDIACLLQSTLVSQTTQYIIYNIEHD